MFAGVHVSIGGEQAARPRVTDACNKNDSDVARGEGNGHAGGYGITYLTVNSRGRRAVGR